jgi:multiple sugar transport system ATP-binding protein
VSWGIRPEHLAISDRGDIEATVEVVEPTGADTLLFIKVGDEAMIVTLHERINVSPGDHVRLSAKVDRINLFDGKTGERLVA